MTTQTYCTRSDLESLCTSDSVLECVDDNEDGTLSTAEEGHVAWAIESAAAEMNAYLEIRYTLADLAGNAWCRTVNAILAVNMLASRRGVTLSAGLVEQRSEALTTLAAIAAGNLAVPQAVSRHETLPTVTNFTTRLTQPYAKIRRVPETSTGKPPSGARRHFPI